MTKTEFIEKIAGYVRKYAPAYGIIVYSSIIAQAILESGWGESKLASQYHNYFGLKCGSKWTGRSVNLTTSEEYTPGVHTTIKDNFRVYDSMEDGVKGYFEFIQLERYHNLRGITDPKKYLETIKTDGYATSSTYVEKTYKLITQYELTQYDKEEVKAMVKYASTLINQAKAWIGRKESDGSHKVIIDTYNGHTPRARGYKVTYTDAWCATFVSACAIATGMEDLIPLECSCNYMISGFKSAGIWIEDESVTPKPGYIIFYDWEDSGSGDNRGSSDHVGIVESVSSGKITVIEGNYSNSVKRRTLSVNAKYIRGYGAPKYDVEVSTTPITSTKTIDELAREVLNGKWGNGSDRKTRLTKAGYNYDVVQSRVNEIVSGKKSVNEIAREVIAGKWGNGSDRKKRLTKAGYAYATVQAEVNRLLK